MAPNPQLPYLRLVAAAHSLCPAQYVEKIPQAVSGKRNHLPPVVVFEDEQECWRMADGFHRRAAYRLGGIKNVEARVIQGTDLEAMSYCALHKK